MKVRVKHSPGTTLGLLVMGGLCEYAAYHIMTNNPNDDGVIWAGALAIFGGISLWGALRGWS